MALEHLAPILYALEVCALTKRDAGREEEAEYFRSLAKALSKASGDAST